MHIDNKFEKQKIKRILNYKKSKKLLKVSNSLCNLFVQKKYSYNFNWLGSPVIQNPSDLIVMQELIFDLKPDLIVETGIARGGSLIFYASILKLLGNRGRVIGVDVDIRPHTRNLLNKHFLRKDIITFQGSSISKEIFEKVKKLTKKRKKVLVCLDSLHTHDHVIEELNLYSTLVTKGSYLIVFDTISGIFDKKTMSIFKKHYRNKHFTKTRNPKSAVNFFLKKNKNFIVDELPYLKSLTSNNPGGFLKKIK